MQGTIIRSKEQSIINEEIPNKYFYLREQQKQTKKHIKQLQNELLNSNSEILKECTSFYQTIYTKQANCEETQIELLNKITKKVQTIQNEKLTSYINKNELKQAINEMKNEKSPGMDIIL